MGFALNLFLIGLLIGLAVAVPVGPIGLLCIRRTLIRGRLAGLASGIGAATADAFYASVASLSMGFISDLISRYQHFLTLAGGLVICLLGLYVFASRPPDTGCKTFEKSIFRAYISTFFLTLTNPATILFFMASFAGFGVTSMINGNYSGNIPLVLGVFLGSSTWWLALSVGTDLLTDHIASRLRLFNRTIGLIIFFMGLYAILISLKG